MAITRQFEQYPSGDCPNKSSRIKPLTKDEAFLPTAAPGMVSAMGCIPCFSTVAQRFWKTGTTSGFGYTGPIKTAAIIRSLRSTARYAPMILNITKSVVSHNLDGREFAYPPMLWPQNTAFGTSNASRMLITSSARLSTLCSMNVYEDLPAPVLSKMMHRNPLATNPFATA